jgi:hypothetical protein|tara:strand:+ start:1254 stop:1673 length:420 start_codon:yes stop_codon:yes gene_type:complete
MKIQETEVLLREMFAIDGRHIDADKIKAWHNVIGNMPLDIAQRALRMARQDERIKYVEPKHIFGKAKEAADAMDRQEERSKGVPEALKGSAQPSCIHGKGILSCDPCCNALWRFHEEDHQHLDVGDQKCEKYAKENILA